MLERALSRVWLVFGVFSTNTNPMFNQLFVVVHKLYFACLSNVLILLNSVLEAPSNGQEQDLKTPEVGCRSEALVFLLSEVFFAVLSPFSRVGDL